MSHRSVFSQNVKNCSPESYETVPETQGDFLGLAQVYDAFDSYLAAVGLQYEWQCIHPAPGYSGLGNKEATYEGGYRLYTITHAQDSVQAAAEG